MTVDEQPPENSRPDERKLFARDEPSRAIVGEPAPMREPAAARERELVAERMEVVAESPTAESEQIVREAPRRSARGPAANSSRETEVRFAFDSATEDFVATSKTDRFQVIQTANQGPARGRFDDSFAPREPSPSGASPPGVLPSPEPGPGDAMTPSARGHAIFYPRTRDP